MPGAIAGLIQGILTKVLHPAANPPEAAAALAPTGQVAATLERAATTAQKALTAPQAAKIATGR